MTNATNYSSQHLENNDYYAESERVVGTWHGLGARMLGLAGSVDHSDFEALRQGLHPSNGKFIRQRHSADRISDDGTTKSHGRTLYDFTFSAPKSISIMAILGDDPRLIKAHQNAVAEALIELESHSATRVRKADANHDRTTANIVLAVYHHDASRELDPQIHTHAVAANLTFDDVETCWKALQTMGIYDRRAYLTEVYRNVLAREVKKLGYRIENHSDSKGNDNGFEISGITQDLIKKFSQRSEQRDKAISKFITEKGRPPTDNEIAVLVRETRPDKLTEISTEQVRRSQLNRLEPDEINLIMELKSQSLSNTELPRTHSPYQSLCAAKNHIFERLSVADDYKVLTEALRHGRGEIDHAELKTMLSVQEQSGAILRCGTQITTKESLKRELGMIECVNRGIGTVTAIDEQNRFIPNEGLNPEQRNVIDFALNSRDQVINISGAAGTGKTATLKELRRGILESGHEIQAIAPTRSAVEELQKVGFKEAMTIERLLQEPSIQRTNCVLIIDEAGMISNRQMSDLLKYSESHSCRIIFSGDVKQIQSVEAGDALSILQKESRLKTVSLTQELRQTSEQYRQAVHELRSNPTKGFEKLDRMGVILEVAEKDRAEIVARTFSDFSDKKLSSIVVCATHDEINRVTAAIRKDLHVTGKIGADHELSRDVPLNWTNAHRADVSRLQPGLILTFHRSVKGIQKNESVEVISVGKGRAIVQSERGETRFITSKQSKCFDVYERQPIGIAIGDKLLLTANRRTKEFKSTNGEIVIVSDIDSQNRIHLQDGRILPKDYRQFSHGYAVTAHRSQGKTVDAVIISADGMRKELFYVAVSRGRKNLAVITSDRDVLRATIGCSMARQSAIELSRKLRPGLHQGINRGMEVARDLANWTASKLRTIFTVKPTIKWKALQLKPILTNQKIINLTPVPGPIQTKDMSYGR